jgi:hypothetical protein
MASPTILKGQNDEVILFVFFKDRKWAKNERERERARERELSLCKIYNMQLGELVHGVSLSNQQKDKTCYRL